MLNVVHNNCTVIEHMMISYIYADKDIFFTSANLPKIYLNLKIQTVIFEQDISVETFMNHP